MMMKRFFPFFVVILLSLNWNVYALQKGDLNKQIAQAAVSIINPNVQYDATYTIIPYPNGDVAANKGVCTDVVIRSFRKVGIDLQLAVHQDMAKHFAVYPKIWGLKAPDKNIDHRRVPNLMTYFNRMGYELPKSKSSVDYQPGDVVAWRLSNGLTHIGVVSNLRANDASRYLMIHNIGAGQVAEDVLFSYEIIGHYRVK